MSILDRARPEIRALKAYSSAHMESGSKGLRLNANELPYPTKTDCGLNLNRYPVPQPFALKNRLSDLYGVQADQILMTRGSDEGIDLIIRAFCTAGQDAIAITPPVFGMYQVAAHIQNAAVLSFPLLESEQFQPDLVKMAEEIPAQCKLVFLCSPNNPVGNDLPRSQVLDFCRKLAQQCLIVVDEAYIEFSDQESLTTEVNKHENLVVLRTLSKAWGLAGARLGSLIGQPSLIDLLRKVLPPYPIPEPVNAIVTKQTDPESQIRAKAQIQEVLSEKKRMHSFLASYPWAQKVFPSSANFILVRFANKSDVMKACQQSGIHLRDQSRQPGLENCLRITIGHPEENTKLIAALNQLFSKDASS